VWVSPDGGWSWGRCVQDAEFSDRYGQFTALDENGYLIVAAGAYYNYENRGFQFFNDVWRSTISFNDLAAVYSSCGITAPSCGLGLRCWPGAGTFKSILSNGGVYCPQCQQTINPECQLCPNCPSCPDTCSIGSGTDSNSSSAAIAFLVIFLLMFLTACTALFYTYYRLRSQGQSSPIPLPLTMQRWWNQGGADGAIRQGTALGAVGGGREETGNSGAHDLYQPLTLRQIQ